MSKTTPRFEAPTPKVGVTLPALFYEARERYGEYDALHRRSGHGWESMSMDLLCTRAEHIALGLLQAGLETGDRVAIYMHSDSMFVLMDLACQIAGFANVPIYLSQAPDAVQFVLAHSGARLLVVSDADLLEEVTPALFDVPDLRTVLVVDGRLPDDADDRTARLMKVEATGRAEAATHPVRARELAAGRGPHDLATIIYTSGTTGRPKGVMLSHENLTSNALFTYSETEGYRAGPDGEVSLSFLPLSHVFARMIGYASIGFGTPIWFSRPDRILEDFAAVRPTIFATVPRVLEKMYAGISEKSESAKGLKGRLARWALARALAYDMTAPDTSKAHQLADRLVYSKWRAIMGGRVRFVSCGGAALNADLANLFGAAGVHILQGYGLTETSPVITFNRKTRNRPGYVGEPLPLVEVKIADDGEIITRGPHVMMGYYRDPERTREVLDEDQWFHTGDVGEFTPDGFLRITDRKKDLFKLSTGKYVMPQPLENRLTTEPLVEQAVVVGVGRSYTAALIFPNVDAVRSVFDEGDARAAAPLDELITTREVLDRFVALVQSANRGMDHWCCIKRFRLVADTVSVENGLLTPTLKIKRAGVREQFAADIDALYGATCSPPAAVVPDARHAAHA